MNDISLALLISVGLTIILSFIQIMFDAKISAFVNCVTGPFILYLVVMITGNVITTLMASSLIGDKLPGSPFIWYSFIGVFGFEALIQKINVTIFDKGVLSINDWITMAKASAVSASLRKSAERDIYEKQQLADKLIQKCSGQLQRIHEYAQNNLGMDTYNKIISEYGTGPNIEARLAFILANEKPIQVKAILAS